METRRLLATYWQWLLSRIIKNLFAMDSRDAYMAGWEDARVLENFSGGAVAVKAEDVRAFLLVRVGALLSCLPLLDRRRILVVTLSPLTGFLDVLRIDQWEALLCSFCKRQQIHL